MWAIQTEMLEKFLCLLKARGLSEANIVFPDIPGSTCALLPPSSRLPAPTGPSSRPPAPPTPGVQFLALAFHMHTSTCTLCTREHRETYLPSAQRHVHVCTPTCAHTASGPWVCIESGERGASWRTGGGGALPGSAAPPSCSPGKRPLPALLALSAVSPQIGRPIGDPVRRASDPCQARPCPALTQQEPPLEPLWLGPWHFLCAAGRAQGGSSRRTAGQRSHGVTPAHSGWEGVRHGAGALGGRGRACGGGIWGVSMVCPTLGGSPCLTAAPVPSLLGLILLLHRFLFISVLIYLL